MADNTGKKILIVEDDQFLREFYQELLTGEGYTIDTAADGEIGEAKLRQGGWNLVLLDIMLPKKDGLHILQDLKANPPTAKNGQIIVLTNLGNDTVASQAFALGANGFLFKSSMNPDEVLKQISSFLQKPPNA